MVDVGLEDEVHRLSHLARYGTAALLAAFALGATETATAAEVNIYSYRQEHLIQPLLDEFTKMTGIRVNLVSGKADVLLERLKSEGMNSPADVLLTVDAGRLIRAQQAGVLQPIRSDFLVTTVPAQYRDPDGYWYGLSVRSRAIFYAKDRVQRGQLSTYADLADPKWKGRICVRSSSNVYNQSLLAAMIAHHGVKSAEAWAKAVVENLARKPQGGDRDQIKAVAAGECDLAIANTYYYGRMLNSKKADQREAAAKTALFWPDQDGLGAHVNVSGAGVTKSAKNKAYAIRLLEFLASEKAQKIYAEDVYEFPVKAGVPISATLEAWGKFKADSLDLAALGKYQAEALRIFDRVGWR